MEVHASRPIEQGRLDRAGVKSTREFHESPPRARPLVAEEVLINCVVGCLSAPFSLIPNYRFERAPFNAPACEQGLCEQRYFYGVVGNKLSCLLSQ